MSRRSGSVLVSGGSAGVSLLAAVVIAGWVSGALVGWSISDRAAASSSCPGEFWEGGPGGDLRDDLDDNVAEDNDWYGKGGPDVLRAHPCNDRNVAGQSGNDNVGGGSGTDLVLGGDGVDSVFGGSDDDAIRGGADGDDLYDAETGDADNADGQGGNDTVDVRDNDILDAAVGGTGTDVCYINRSTSGRDSTSTCESVP
jgi:hypothetical protein